METTSEARDFIDLAGSVLVPAKKRDVAWHDVLRETRSIRAKLTMRAGDRRDVRFGGGAVRSHGGA